MGRKITMKGKNAQYIEHRGVNATPDNEREILMEGDEAVYQEMAYGQAGTATQNTASASKDTAKDYRKEAARELLMDNAEYVESEEKADYSASIGECFRNASEFVRQRALAVVNDYYLGSAANLALIETTLYDHNLLIKRNKHTAFVKSLMAWGAIAPANEETIAKIANSIAYKMRTLPASGYKDWNGKDFVNDKKTCSDIGKALGQTIPYSRKKED